MDIEHNTFAYCTSFLFSLSPRLIQQDDYGSGASSTKKRKRGGNGVNGRHEVKRINKNGSEATSSINK
jgi:hypothetical protein